MENFKCSFMFFSFFLLYHFSRSCEVTFQERKDCRDWVSMEWLWDKCNHVGSTMLASWFKFSAIPFLKKKNNASPNPFTVFTSQTVPVICWVGYWRAKRLLRESDLSLRDQFLYSSLAMAVRGLLNSNILKVRFRVGTTVAILAQVIPISCGLRLKERQLDDPQNGLGLLSTRPLSWSLPIIN